MPESLTNKRGGMWDFEKGLVSTKLETSYLTILEIIYYMFKGDY